MGPNSQDLMTLILMFSKTASQVINNILSKCEFTSCPLDAFPLHDLDHGTYMSQTNESLFSVGSLISLMLHDPSNFEPQILIRVFPK